MSGRQFKSVKFLFLILLLPALMVSPAGATDFGRQVTAQAQTLYLNGSGPRKKAFLTVYDIALYLTEKGSDARAIIAADHPMALNLVVRSRFANAERITDAFREGLEKSTGGRSEAIGPQSKVFLDVFESGVVRDDRFEFLYLPEQGVQVSKNGSQQVTIPGLAFKQALFGIWLSKTPVSSKLKAQLLGQQ